MSKKKGYIDTNVYETSLDRIRDIYDKFDKVVVSFSGGKDSTVVLNLCLEIAKEKNKLPLEVIFFDEEAIHPPTIEYCKRVSERKDINFKWYCLEVKHRNACSNEEPFWYTWDKEKKDLWVRPLPDTAITEHPRFRKGDSFQDFAPYIYSRKDGTVAMLTGIRTEESLRRLRVILNKKNQHYINTNSENKSSVFRAFPIYDWSSQDVWIAVKKLGWDYNTTYDIFNQTRLHNKFLTQRVCPPFGEEPLRGLWIYSECFPEMWHKMLNRVKGVATAWRYANTELYAAPKEKPIGITWEQYLKIILDSYEHDSKQDVIKTINKYIRYHQERSKKSIPESEENPLSGVSWKFLCRIAIRGDFKGRQQSVITKAQLAARERLKHLTEDEIKKQYG